MTIKERLRQLFQRDSIDTQKKPLKLVQERSNPDESVMLHTATEAFYLDVNYILSAAKTVK